PVSPRSPVTAFSCDRVLLSPRSPVTASLRPRVPASPLPVLYTLKWYSASTLKRLLPTFLNQIPSMREEMCDDCSPHLRADRPVWVFWSCGWLPGPGSLFTG